MTHLTTPGPQPMSVSDGAGSNAPPLKPGLAYLSPLPPLKSGISYYSSHLLRHLASFYNITVIVDQDGVDDPWVNQYCDVRDAGWFSVHGGDFDRILYHFGNSPFHCYMVDLLEHWPGVVVLHDFFLGQMLERLNNERPWLLDLCLFRGWGYSGLLEAQETGIQTALWRYPFNFDILQRARDVIVHSPYSARLAAELYPGGAQENWTVIPHLHDVDTGLDSAVARKQLDLPNDAFVVCSFGHVTPTKMHDLLLEAWLRSDLGKDSQCELVFVGEAPEADFQQRLDSLRARHPGRINLRITGWTDSATYRNYLAAADLAVQLRTRSRGETSGAILDCMGSGVPLIANAHGTQADLPVDGVQLLPDEVSAEQLAVAMNRLWRDADQRAQLSRNAREYIRSHNNPDHCARRYHQTLEAAYDDSKVSNAVIGRPRHLLVDVSAMVHHDLKTGIERVVSSQLGELVANPPQGFRIEPVFLAKTDGHWHYRTARKFSLGLLGLPDLPVDDEPMHFEQGDILYIADLNHRDTVLAAEDFLFQTLRLEGVRIHALIHDVLPITLPHLFPPGARESHQRWLESLCGFADQLICTSRAVADSVQQWLDDQPPWLSRRHRLAVNHHGANLPPGDSNPVDGETTYLLKKLGNETTFLMVGTIEPRKGYGQALLAFEELWARGHEINLVIVGGEGWQNLSDDQRRDIPAIVAKLEHSPHSNRRLFWLQGISDSELGALYKASSCLLSASIDEGFGLPVREAAQWGLPVLARDIPVFREVASPDTRYFSGDSPEDITRAILSWLEDNNKHEQPRGAAKPPRTWEDNVRDLKRLLTDEAALPACPRGCLSVDELFSHDGADFVTMAYITFLARLPGEEEREHYLEPLNNGISKSSLAAAIRYSGEAGHLTQHLQLRKAKLLNSLGQTPVIGRMTSWCSALVALPRLKTALLAQQQRLQQTIRESARLRMDLEKDLSDLAADQKPIAHHQQQLTRQLENLEQEKETLIRRLKILEQAGPGQNDSNSSATEGAVDDNFYVAFEQHFRGSPELVKERLSYYLPIIANTLTVPLQGSPMLDIGCGRGEWLELLNAEGFNTAGVDLNDDNVQFCRSNQLNVSREDGITWLREMESDRAGLISAFHVIEHLSLSQLAALLSEALRVLKPGGMLILETPNPENLITASRRFYTDPTHRNPVPAELTEFLLTYHQFENIGVHRLHPDPADHHFEDQSPMAETLNRLLYGPQDYGVIATKPVT